MVAADMIRGKTCHKIKLKHTKWLNFKTKLEIALFRYSRMLEYFARWARDGIFLYFRGLDQPFFGVTWGLDFKILHKISLKRDGSIRPNPEGQIIENRKAEFYWPLGQNRKAENLSTLISAQYIIVWRQLMKRP